MINGIPKLGTPLKALPLLPPPLISSLKDREEEATGVLTPVKGKTCTHRGLTFSNKFFRPTAKSREVYSTHWLSGPRNQSLLPALLTLFSCPERFPQMINSFISNVFDLVIFKAFSFM